jgi:hypothetical protein
MQRLILAALLLACASPVAAADDRPFQPKKTGSFDVDGLLRQEWTTKFFDPEAPTQSRRVGRLLPRFTAGGDNFKVGVGGDFYYSSDENTEVTAADGTVGKPALLRDNYDSRSARLDLAFAHLQPLKWVQLDAGRFVMPFGLTEMIWDRDLRPQGGAVRLGTSGVAELEALSVGALYSQGAHVFDDKDTRLLMFNGTARLKGSDEAHFELQASWMQWERLDSLEGMIRRQNTRGANGIVPDDYRIVDVVGRIQLTGNLPLQIIGDMCWNTRLETKNRGVWLAAVIGSLTASRARAEYTFAQVDKDATVAAYASDDFFWGTGWTGHRGELGTRVSDRMSLHAIGQLQRFKDAPNVAERDHWLQRFRIEARVKN